MKNKTAGAFMLLTATLIWGTAFVAQSLGAGYLGPFTFNGIRFLIGALVLLPFILVTKYHKNGRQTRENRAQSGDRLRILKAGGACGVLIFGMAALQQVGISYTTVGKAGFVSALYVVMVPILGLFFGRRVGARTWVCIALATAGLYFLCMKERISLGFGDALMLISAFVTAIHILVTDYYSSKVDCLQLSCLQLFVCGALSLAAAFIFEKPSLPSILAAAAPILYMGILCCGAAFTLKTLGQKNVPPTAASLILSLESVFSVLSGWVFLKETLSLREAAGCALMFGATVLSQLPESKREKKMETAKTSN